MRARALAVATAALAACYRGSSPPPAPVEPPPPRPPSYAATVADPLGFLPVESELVAHLDVRHLRTNPTWERLEPVLRERGGAGLVMFQQVCGFDPLASIQRVTIGIHDLDADRPSGVAVVGGIDRDALMACLARPEMAKSSGVRIDGGIVTVPMVRSDTGAPGSEPPVVFAFADASTVVMILGRDASRDTMIGVLGGGAPLRGSRAFMELVAGIGFGDAFWFLLNGNASALDRMASLGSRPRAIVGTVSLGSGLAGALRVRLDTPAQAAQISTMFQSQLAMIGGFVESIAATAEDADVVVRVQMTQEQLDTIVNLAAGLSP